MLMFQNIQGTSIIEFIGKSVLGLLWACKTKIQGFSKPMTLLQLAIYNNLELQQWNNLINVQKHVMFCLQMFSVSNFSYMINVQAVLVYVHVHCSIAAWTSATMCEIHLHNSAKVCGISN